MIVCQRDHIDATCSDLRRIGDSIAPKNTVLESETAETVVDPRPINISPVVARRSTPACCSQPEAAIVKAEAQRPSRRSQWKPHASDHPRATLHADPPVAGTPCRPEVPRYFPGAPRCSNTRNRLAFLKVGKALSTRGQFSTEAEVKRPKCLKSSTQVCVPTFSYSFLKSKREIEIQGSTSFLHVRRQFKT